MRTHTFKSFLLIAAATLFMVGCSESDTPTDPVEQQAPYGYFYLGEEEIPVNTFTYVEEGHLLLKLSPLDEILSATTYAVFGVSTDFVGQRIDVQTKYHNDDYIVIYEDPTRYYAPFRQLRSGTILLDRNEAGEIRAEVDVVLYDGTRLCYSNPALK